MVTFMQECDEHQAAPESDNSSVTSLLFYFVFFH